MEQKAAHAYRRAGNFANAERCYATALQGLQSQPQRWIRAVQGAAVLAHRQRRYDEARRLFERGTQADPTHAPLWQAWGLMEKELGNYAEALRLVEKAIACEKDNPYCYNARGLVYAAMGKKEQAHADQNKALELVERKLKHAQGNKRNKLERLKRNVQNNLRALR